MTVMIECKNICKEYGEKQILKDINLKLEYGEKIGIVGSNGMGKTTLADIIIGETLQTSGEVSFSENLKNIGYMKQITDYKGSTLSGGEKTKKKLNELLYGKYNMLILDEPTNHLDYEGCKYLVKKVNEFKGTVLMISHDRYFLDRCADKIIELENGSIKIYNGNYTFYRNEKKIEFENNLHLYAEQEKVKNKINNQIAELRQWSGKAHKEAAAKAIETGNKFGGKQHNRAKAKKMDKQIKSRIKRLQKIDLEGIEKPKEESKVLFEINESSKTGSVILSAKDISKVYGNKTLFAHSSFYVKQNEKVGILGPNGCGKTTLIKALLKDNVTIEGELYISPSRKIGYISQDVLEFDKNLSVLELFNIQSQQELADIRTKLSLIGFERNIVDKPVNVLSAGEKMKIKILLMIKQQCDVLILDEPTNHIDLHVREQLEEVLKQYNGTIILVTHDRYMMGKICNRLLVFEDKKIQRYEYGIDEYLEHINKKKQKVKNSDEVLVLKNRLAYILSELSCCKEDSKEYKKLDEEYKNILKMM